VIVLRSLVYSVWLYGGIVLFALLGLPLMLGPARRHRAFVRAWAATQLFGLRWICGVKVVHRGLEHRRRTGPALVAAKHQGMLDVIAPFTVLDDPCFVLKKELIALPFFGWHAAKADMIPIDREAAASALKKMVAAARRRIADGRQLVIFPEGTRTEPGAATEYKPGVAALYRDLGLPCVPVATNSGVHWPPHGFIRRPGTVVFEWLEPIPAGLKRQEFMAELERRIETASAALLTGPR
jgi:1-acyl-sn-glycerol-3-phosphate acyltransferase